MKSYTNTKLRKKLQNKGIILDEKKKKHFDKYSYYQVINAYKNIFSTSIKNIDDIENNIKNSIGIDRYRKNFSISNDTSNSTLYRGILISICQKYGINLKYTDSNDELKENIKELELLAEKLIGKEAKQMKYICTVCGETYDEAVDAATFEDLPEDWVCPVCGVGKDSFEKVEEN